MTTSERETGGKELEHRLGHRFNNPLLLAEALTHSSAAGVSGASWPCNERMEFLGDRVLGLVIAHLLYTRFSSEDEGALARRYAALVRREALARVAEALGLANHIRMSRGEEEIGGRRNPNALADVCEAVIAAVYLDGGFEAASGVVRRHWDALVDESERPPRDSKTELQEWAQGRGMALPAYREIDRTGPPHAPTFRVEVSLPGVGSTSGSGPSKRAAEKAAARSLLAELRVPHEL